MVLVPVQSSDAGSTYSHKTAVAESDCTGHQINGKADGILLVSQPGGLVPVHIPGPYVAHLANMLQQFSLHKIPWVCAGDAASLS
jgi:hypothetical protein